MSWFSEFTRGKYRKRSAREAPLKLHRSREGIKMKLISGGDGVISTISRCEEVEISAPYVPSLLACGFLAIYHFQMSSDGPVLCRNIGKPMPKS